ncbi:hypothetical protein OMAG_000772 [Candidatus Omnitrophus magneticus]|uniref:Uncharacterized protein n=1 Tax=Candidatus Omnitrophus magneticus TaxID=1609969 RepID=A0A0F0CPV6_9BACT|nr:hypothetical protein OMAG_000772 [Candidatus Omnitrophus magneticus]
MTKSFNFFYKKNQKKNNYFTNTKTERLNNNMHCADVFFQFLLLLT